MARFEILLVMTLSPEVYAGKAWNVGVGSALMIVSGYYGELIVTGDLTPRWSCWFLCFFLDIVYQLLLGLSNATNQESDKDLKTMMDKDELKTKMLVQARCLATVAGV